VRKIIIGVLSIGLLSALVANDKVYSYTPEEMHNMASSYIELKKQVANSTFKNNLRLIGEASTFRGYIASALDFTDKTFLECTKTHTVDQIAHRTAIVVAGRKLNRAGISSVTVMISIGVACDDTNWK